MEHKQASGQHHLKNADFLAWRIGNYQRSQKEKAIRNILYARERDRLAAHH